MDSGRPPNDLVFSATLIEQHEQVAKRVIPVSGQHAAANTNSSIAFFSWGTTQNFPIFCVRRLPNLVCYALTFQNGMPRLVTGSFHLFRHINAPQN